MRRLVLLRFSIPRSLWFLVFMLVALPTWSAKPAPTPKPPAKVIAGWVENIVLVSNGDKLKAKLDTGATTSSINARNVKRFTREGEKWVSFELIYKTSRGAIRNQKLERPLTRTIRVKEHEGENGRRPVVDLKFCFNGVERTAQFSLVDRSKFVYPVLLGRRFLAGHAVIDPEKTFLTEAACGNPPKQDM